ncbi:MAG TPA: anaerobic glycerol-3-phosphate dehydrogenase subunit GlpC [Spirochaetota bacterium]|nr:anaerobic glycerol-3-phosphate dehydrogenase subunit GlpC [Spirochaetota bacterium]HPI90863.1 anaerobic glycerol-3-phosphate dehydrogenase subunit GlpC [Spirochaetota bacterium]HPR49939.1 anaerobic glycerol-3-phosphate dehydrogenase subunit GlpC [Spirochaetota bacterium]
MIKLENISFDHCIKCTVCTIYCPVARNTHLFPGPKQSGPDAERLRIKNPELVDASLKYCTNCKRCEIACPSNVKIADIIQDAKWKYTRARLFRPRDFFMSRTDFVGSMATIFGPLVNFVVGLGIVKFFMDLFLSIPLQRSFPSYNTGTFASWFKRKRKGQKKYRSKVTYFHGCYVNYNKRSLGEDLVSVLNAMDIGVEITSEKCCGVPLIANGYLTRARKNARYNIKHLSEQKKNNSGKIVATSSSCAFALKHEYANLLALDNSSIYTDTEYITKYLFDRFEDGIIPPLKPVNIRAAYHAPCHLERLGGVMYTIDILKRIPGLDLVILNSECCGIAGTYGFKKEYYQISQAIGQHLFRLIDRANPEYVITDCETCAMQIEMNTPYQVLHPINVLAMALK